MKVTTSDENVNGFDIYVDDQKLTYSTSAENIYGLQEDFAEEKLYHIRVEAHWKDGEGENDDLIYLPAEETFDVTLTKGLLSFLCKTELAQNKLRCKTLKTA